MAKPNALARAVQPAFLSWNPLYATLRTFLTRSVSLHIRIVQVKI